MVALANKMARIVWALMAKGVVYKAPAVAAIRAVAVIRPTPGIVINRRASSSAQGVEQSQHRAV